MATQKPKDEPAETHQRIIAHFVTSLLWTAALTLVFAFLLDKVFPVQGEQLKGAAYTHLSGSLAQMPDREDIPVSVIDISALTPKQVNRPGGVISVTPRAKIQKFLQTIITNSETCPRAVGIDVDFSPDKYGLSDSGDPAFFDFCAQMGKDHHVPIYLGVARQVAAGPDGWLGLRQYSGLAANIAVPREDKRYLPARIWQRSAPSAESLPSMGVVLGNAYAGEPPKRMRGLVRVFQDDSLDGNGRQLPAKISATKFLVNYSLLKDLRNRARPIKDFGPPFSEREKEYLSDKIVLLGNDIPSGQDTQLFPDGKLGPGVYLHACAAATLASAPLYEFGFWESLGLDFLLALVMISSYTLVRLWLHHKNKPLKVGLKVLFAALAALVVWGAAGLARGEIVPGVHIMWLDFILVAIAYLLHSPIEEFWSAHTKSAKEALTAEDTKRNMIEGTKKTEEEMEA